MYQARIIEKINHINQMKSVNRPLTRNEIEYIGKLEQSVNKLINKLEKFGLKKQGYIQDKVLNQVKEYRKIIDLS